MKVTNWRKKMAATLVGAGLLAPSAAHAANLNTNLAVDPGFENVNTAVTCCYMNNGVQLNSWSDGTGTGFAYNYGLAWDAGGPLASGGTYYFAAGSMQPDPPATGPGEVAQDIAVGTGASGTLIGQGEAAVALSAFFTSYNNQTHFGSLHVEFLNAGNISLGSGVLTAKVGSPWHEERTAVFAPIGTTTVRASVYGTNSNAYIDNVDVRVVNAVDEVLYAEVNTANGQVTIKNQSGDPFHMDYYKIESAGSALDPTAWNSLQEQNLAGFPAGNGSGNGWEQLGGATAKVIGESYLTGNSVVANGASIGLGAAFNVGGAHDLVFRYAVVGEQVLSADFNGDGDVDGGDFLAWQRGNGTTATATKAEGDANGDLDVDEADLSVWRLEFGDTSFEGVGALTRGFVRYVTPASAAVPEPSSALLVGAGLTALAIGVRRKR